MPKKQPAKETLTTDDRLDIIIGHLRRMDKRDRLRTWGGFFRGILGLIPIVVLLLSIWYFYEHGDELIQQITQQAAREAASITGDNAGKFMQQIELMFPGAAGGQQPQ